MVSFSPFVDFLAEIEDPRRTEGKLNRLPKVVLFAILAIVAGANSYRAIHSFIDVHLVQLRDAFGVKWRKAAAYTTIRGILRQLDPASVEAVFRRHAAILNDAAEVQDRRHVAIDGKTLRRSFDSSLDRRAAHMLSAFASDTALVLAHLNCDEKSNEIPAVQTLLGSLPLSDAVVTVDAMHGQKSIRTRWALIGSRPAEAVRTQRSRSGPLEPSGASRGTASAWIGIRV
jgi:hypothetical protein